MVNSPCRRRVLLKGSALAIAYSVLTLPSAIHAQAPPDTIQRVKKSIVAVGTLQKTRSPPFVFHGTGFVVGNGTLVATNAHVIKRTLATGADPEQLAIAMPTGDALRSLAQVVRVVSLDEERDLALLRLTGPALPPLSLKNSDKVREGDQYLVTGYPIGAVLGLFPATHRAMVAAITPIAIPPANARQLNAQVIRRLESGPYRVFQLDATTYPGNSGSPLYDPLTGEVVGIVNMVFVKGTKEAALTDPSGISYAIPATFLDALLRRTE